MQMWLDPPRLTGIGTVARADGHVAGAALLR